MSVLTNIYQSIKQTVMATKKLPTTPEAWVKFAKKNKVKEPFFSYQGLTRRTSDGKEYHYIEDFNADGGTVEKVKVIKRAK